MTVHIETIQASRSAAVGRTLYDVVALVDDRPCTFTVFIEDVGPEGDKIRIVNFVGDTYWEDLGGSTYFVTQICKLTGAVHGHRPVAFPVSLDEPRS